MSDTSSGSSRPSFISRRAAALEPYRPGEQPKDLRYIKLNTNENPYPPAPEVEAFLRRVDASELRLYPDPDSGRFLTALSRLYGIDEDRFFVGNGSDEVLSFIFYAFFDGQRGPLLFPRHSYSFYPVYCSFYAIPYETVDLDENFFIRPRDYIRRIRQDSCCGIIFPNPNAPTGTALSKNEIKELLDALPQNFPIVIDEAYVDFGAESSLELVEHHENLIVVQTLSKSRSLAGMRAGYAIAGPKTIETLNTVKNSFNSYPLDRLAQETAALALKNRGHFEETRRRIVSSRERTIAKLEGEGWTVLPSKANFIFARHDRLPGKELYSRLKKRGILVRHFAKPGIENFLRISIGTDQEMESLLTELSNILRDSKEEK
jgi:histidinol-phosphate aminotransferase